MNENLNCVRVRPMLPSFPILQNQLANQAIHWSSAHKPAFNIF